MKRFLSEKIPVFSEKTVKNLKKSVGNRLVLIVFQGAAAADRVQFDRDAVCSSGRLISAGNDPVELLFLLIFYYVFFKICKWYFGGICKIGAAEVFLLSNEKISLIFPENSLKKRF